ncbi:conserved hypothetical protein [Paraburkholderia tropica]|nr:conserved hypothetical protein [Paraburkholderia tropica]
MRRALASGSAQTAQRSRASFQYAASHPSQSTLRTLEAPDTLKLPRVKLPHNGHGLGSTKWASRGQRARTL